MSTEQNKAAARKVMETLNQGNLDEVIKLYSPQAQFFGFAPKPLDVQGYRQNMSELLTAFPGARFPVEDLIAEGDTVVARHKFEGTQQKAYQGIPASGKHATASAFATFHFRDGQIYEVRLNADFMAILQQIGAIPTPGQV